jgi:hypothetical protein
MQQLYAMSLRIKYICLTIHTSRKISSVYAHSWDNKEKIAFWHHVKQKKLSYQNYQQTNIIEKQLVMQANIFFQGQDKLKVQSSQVLKIKPHKKINISNRSNLRSG